MLGSRNELRLILENETSIPFAGPEDDPETILGTATATARPAMIDPMILTSTSSKADAT